MRAELAQLVADGKREQEIVDYYIAKYGSQEPLAQPIDQGFNRLAWAVPYLLGAGGLALVGTVAVRWSRRRDTEDATAGRRGRAPLPTPRSKRGWTMSSATSTRHGFNIFLGAGLALALGAIVLLRGQTSGVGVASWRSRCWRPA